MKKQIGFRDFCHLKCQSEVSVLIFKAYSTYIVTSQLTDFYVMASTGIKEETNDGGKNQSIDLFCKSMDRFLYDRNRHHERVNST